MSILLVLIPITLLLVVAGGFAFFWAVNHDQFDDMDTPSLLPLTDSDPVGEQGRALPADRPGESPGDYTDYTDHTDHADRADPTDRAGGLPR